MPIARRKISASAARKVLTTMAFRIADSTMYEQLFSHSLPEPAANDASERRFTLVSQRGRRVRELAKADPAIIEACQWMFARGTARFEKGMVIAKVV